MNATCSDGVGIMPPGIRIGIANFVYRRDDVLDILGAHGMENRQAEQAFVRLLRHRQLSSAITKPLAMITMKMHWDVMHLHPNVLRPRGTENLGPTRRELCHIQAHWIQMPRRRDFTSHSGHNDSR